MNVFVLLLNIVPLVFICQTSRQASESLKVKWKKEFETMGSGSSSINGIILDSRQNLCIVAKEGNTKVFGFTSEAEPTEIQLMPSYVWWIAPYDDNYISRELNCVNLRDFASGIVLEKNCYVMPPDWATTSPVSAFYNSAFYYAGNYFLCKFKKDGEVVFKKEVAESGNSNFIRVRRSFIYLYGRYNTLSDTRLMQYDTLGNQKWSVPISLLVYGMYADADGNCYMLTSEGGGVGHVQKYNIKGELVFDVKLPGQRGTNAFKLGDSLFICGQVSGAVREDGQKMAAFCILSAKNGEVYHQQTIDLDPDPSHLEDFTHIVSDGTNIYAGGYFGGQGKTNVLIKYSREGNTTGLKDEKTPRTGFNVFPNPGGSKFTVTCENNKTKTVKATVRSLSGQIVFSKEVSCNNDSSFTLDLGKQPAGNYTIEIDSGDKREVKKILVE